MARPTCKVTTKNYHTARDYFERLLQRQGLYGKYSSIQHLDAELKANRAFDDFVQY